MPLECGDAAGHGVMHWLLLPWKLIDDFIGNSRLPGGLSTAQWVTTYACVPHCGYANRGNCHK
jgi:hypothetical protein